MKKRILIYYALLITVGLLITGATATYFFQRFYQNQVHEKLFVSANLIRLTVAREIELGFSPDYNELATKFASQLSDSNDQKSSMRKSFSAARVTFIAFDGVVLGESDASFEDMVNHANRIEFIKAQSNGVGNDVRMSETLSIPFYYLALLNPSDQTVIRIAVPLQEISTIERTISIYMLIGIVAALILTGVMAAGLSENLTRPINTLIAATKQIAEGRYSKRVVLNTKNKQNELYVLGATFNAMASKLEKNMQAMQEQNTRVRSMIDSLNEGVLAVDNQHRIVFINKAASKIFHINSEEDKKGIHIVEVLRNTKINQLLEKTMETNEMQTDEIYITPPQDQYLRLSVNRIGDTTEKGCIITIQDVTAMKKLEKMRSEFVSNVTHELKTPLTSIKGFIDTLKHGGLDDPEMAMQFLDIIEIEADRLHALIHDILQLSEIESLKKDSRIQKHNLKKILEEILPMIHKAAEEKNIDVQTHLEEHLEMQVNSDRIKQLFLNLIDNAIKYNDQNGKVEITGYKVEGAIVIKIEDTGIGIPKEHRERVFERFYRIDKGRSRASGGTGLGLSIVKHIVNLYNGTIQLHDRKDQGTLITVRFPI